MKIDVTFRVRCNKPGSYEPCKLNAVYNYAYVKSKVFNRLARFTEVSKTVGDLLVFHEVDITRPELAEAMQVLYDAEWYPGDSLMPHSDDVNWYEFFCVNHYSSEEFRSFPYLHCTPEFVNIKKPPLNSRYKDGLPMVNRKYISEKRLVYVAGGTSLGVHPRVLEWLREAGLTRKLVVRSVSYDIPPPFQLAWLSSDTILPKASNNFHAVPLGIPDNELSAEQRMWYEEGFQEGIHDYQFSGDIAVYYRKSDIKSLEPFDFAYTFERACAPADIPEYKACLHLGRGLIVSQAVYRLFQDKGMGEMFRWRPVIVHDKAHAPRWDTYGPELDPFMKRFLPPDE